LESGTVKVIEKPEEPPEHWGVTESAAFIACACPTPPIGSRFVYVTSKPTKNTMINALKDMALLFIIN
jgi:hypothetical protein